MITKISRERQIISIELEVMFMEPINIRLEEKIIRDLEIAISNEIVKYDNSIHILGTENKYVGDEVFVIYIDLSKPISFVQAQNIKDMVLKNNENLYEIATYYEFVEM